MKFVLSLILINGAFAASAATETRDFDSKTIHKVEIENTEGWVKISGTATERTTVSAEKADFDEKKCRLEIKQEGAELKVDVEKTGWGRAVCKVNLTLNVPPAVEIDVENGSGDLEISGTQGKIDYNLGSGEVKIDAQVKELEGKTGSGSVDVKGLSGEAELKSGSGDVKLVYAAVPVRGSLTIKTGSGNATVSMPATAQVRSSLRSGSGQMRNEFGERKDAGFHVRMETGSGNLDIKKIQ